MRLTRILATAGASLALAATLTGPAAAEGPSLRGACPDRGNEASIYGAWARWDVNCNQDGTVSVTGELQDTAADGECAQADAVNPANNHHQYVNANGWGQAVAINFNLGQGNIGELRIRTINC
ncbi:hypothetical protein [Streptomyces cavernicola]|uniref:Secreted protein n=1 Tax=Streptomyces cavernicola TaxID=3043613 RepID=A0ABT6S5P1_9ACTN|nr:hypothetical protein [Streptomyces sp. B-S-A6]MDI3403224.1 hypothetical protein [Streptomyces sp. B-S-A6]